MEVGERTAESWSPDKGDRRQGITIRNGVAFTISGALLLQAAVMVFQFGRLTERLEQTIVALVDMKTELRATKVEVSELNRRQARVEAALPK